MSGIAIFALNHSFILNLSVQKVRNLMLPLIRSNGSIFFIYITFATGNPQQGFPLWQVLAEVVIYFSI